MATTYSTLVAAKSAAGSIRRWVNWDLLDAEQCLEEAQLLIFQTLRVREMRAEFDPIGVSQGDYKKALPAGFLDPISLIDKTNNNEIGLVDEEVVMRKRGYEDGSLLQSIPTLYAIWDESIQFDYAWESGATLVLYGYKAPTLLSADNLTNFLTTRYLPLLKSACMARAFYMMKNAEMYQAEMATLNGLIEATNSESDLSRRGSI